MPRVIKPNKNPLAFTAGIIILFVSLASIIYTSVMYMRYSHSTLRLTSTEPFVAFSTVAGLYDSADTVQKVTQLKHDILDQAWCNEHTGNYNLRPETRSPACVCLMRVYTSFLTRVVDPLVNNTSLVDRFIAHVLKPYNNDTWAMDLWTTYSNMSELVVAGAGVYKTPTVYCLSQRATWRVYPYSFEVHPLAMFFYTSMCLFVLGVSYILRVESPGVIGEYMKFLVLGLSVLGMIFLLYMYYPANWIYAIALLMYTLNFMLGINDEFISIAEYYDENTVLHRNTFSPPHPLMVGMWTFFLVFFPMVVVYVGLANLMRDMVALFAMYVIAYLVAACMQRLFWTKWYIQPFNYIENFMFDYTHKVYKLSEKSSGIFRAPLEEILTFTFGILFFLLIWTVFMGWYSQSIQSGNWFALIVGFALVLFFVLEFFTIPVSLNQDMNNIEQLMPFDVIQFLQVIIIVGSHTALVLGASIDAAL